LHGIAAASLTGCAGIAVRAAPKVVVIGGGWGGATAARYLRLWSDQSIDVTLIEPNEAFVSCPMSNLVIGGVGGMADITQSYASLERVHGIRRIADRALRIDAARRIVTLAGGGKIAYDRLIVSPGIDFHWDTLPGMAAPGAKAKVLHAWKAGPQTLALRRQLEAMRDGGVFAISIPLAPYRCPPAPYERACLVAHAFSRAKPRSKVLILDANEDVTSKAALFKKAWADRYPGIVEYRPNHNLVDVDASSNTLKFEFNDDVKADVLNVIPQMGAGEIAVANGLATADRRWCEVDFLTFESKAVRNVHVLGDAIQIAPVMPKSAHMANQHGKTCAAAVIALLTGHEVNALPLYNSTCYSFVSDRDAVHVASVHRYDAAQKTMLPVSGAGGLSAEANRQEGTYALAWARNIRADTFGS
jgi:NADPH-dependent 2,4-dienoyl-CoA reductase/sulfur reductase-like enzyme